ncbi:MAG: ankyrin repeat domain-containing protein [Mariprofundaceae bacterium]|nr:ankyrin repeat domain-containing protein [Mariprofundaceae bacterium]
MPTDRQTDEQTKHCEAWFSAARSGDVESLKLVLESGSDVNAVDELKNTALHYAAKHAHLDVMRFLVEHGADLNATNDRLSTPLHLTEKNIDAIRLLLEAGADPNLKDADWDYPYYFAFYGSMTRELTDLYIKHGAHLTYMDDKKR